MIEVGAEPLRQVGDPPRQGRPRRRRPSRPRPDGRDLPRGRLRGLVRRRRQLARRRDRHDEEHGLRARRRAPDGRDRGVRDRCSAATSSRDPAGRAGDGLDRGARLAADRRRARCLHPRPVVDADGGRGRRRATGSTVEAGIADLDVMKTREVGVLGLPARRVHDAARDRGPDHGDEGHARPGATIDGDATTTPRSRRSVRTLLDVFAEHHSVSVQASIWIVGQAILERHPEVAEITMTLPNLHHWTVDLEPVRHPNDREIYVSTTEPHGLIQATVRRFSLGSCGSRHRPIDALTASWPGARFDAATRVDLEGVSRGAILGTLRDTLAVTTALDDPGHGSTNRPAPDQRGPRRRGPDRHRAPRRSRRRRSPRSSRERPARTGRRSSSAP